MSVNIVSITGNLTRDGELRATPSGTPVMNLSVAVNDRHKNQQTGEWEDVPNFVDCVMWGNRASSLQPWLTKGMKVSISGSLRYSSWDKDGAKRSKLEVYVSEIDLMSRPHAREEQPQDVMGADIDF